MAIENRGVGTVPCGVTRSGEGEDSAKVGEGARSISARLIGGWKYVSKCLSMHVCVCVCA